MGAKFEIGRIAGLPIFIDVTFIILIVLWGERYFTSGSATAMSMGFLLVVGLALSILLHELAHAVVGANLGVRPSHVELNGLGGLCYWASPMRPEAWRRIAISLAGPAANFALYYLFLALAGLPVVAENRFVSSVAHNLAFYNWLLCMFNLLPAFPLDGGKALEALLGTVLSSGMARMVVGVLGLCVAAYLVYLGINGSIWMLFLAVMIGLANYDAVQSGKNPPWQRRN
jgi:Zn-dependent protease